MTIRSKITAFLLAALALLASPLSGHAESGPADAPQKHFLWKVTGSKGTVYLFGTVHLGSPDFYPLPAIIEDSFKRADTLVEEIKITPSDIAQMERWVIQHGIYSGSDTISDHLSEETNRHLQIYLKQQSWLEQQVITKMRPWAVAIMVTEANSKRLGLDPENGLDKHFLKEAEEQHKPVEALETIASQLQFLGELTSDQEENYLMQTLAESENPTSHLEVLVNAWREGDSEKMRELLSRSASNDPKSKVLMKTLLDDRNDAMTKQIEQFLGTRKTYFVAVGAGHMLGEHGIVSQLQAKRFTVRQL